jgi:hypothetical protein
VNYNGQVDTAYHQPIPMYDIDFNVRLGEPVKKIRMLKSKQNIWATSTNGMTSFTIPVLYEYEVIIVEH